MIGRKNIEITSKAFTTNVYNTRDNVDGLDFSTLFRLLKKYEFFSPIAASAGWLIALMIAELRPNVMLRPRSEKSCQIILMILIMKIYDDNCLFLTAFVCKIL